MISILFRNCSCSAEQNKYICQYSSVNLSCFTVTPMDYESLDVILMLDSCDTRKCVIVTIVDDSQVEPDENLTYHLARTPGLDLSIQLDPVNGEIEIVDNDG